MNSISSLVKLAIEIDLTLWGGLSPRLQQPQVSTHLTDWDTFLQIIRKSNCLSTYLLHASISKSTATAYANTKQQKQQFSNSASIICQMAPQTTVSVTRCSTNWPKHRKAQQYQPATQKDTSVKNITPKVFSFKLRHILNFKWKINQYTDIHAMLTSTKLLMVTDDLGQPQNKSDFAIKKYKVLCSVNWKG